MCYLVQHILTTDSCCCVLSFEVYYLFSIIPVKRITQWARSLVCRRLLVKVTCVRRTYPMAVHMFLIRHREQTHNKQ